MDDKRNVKNFELISKYLHELLFEPMGTEIELYNSWFNLQSYLWFMLRSFIVFFRINHEFMIETRLAIVSYITHMNIVLFSLISIQIK